MEDSETTPVCITIIWPPQGTGGTGIQVLGGCVHCGDVPGDWVMWLTGATKSSCIWRECTSGQWHLALGVKDAMEKDASEKAKARFFFSFSASGNSHTSWSLTVNSLRIHRFQLSFSSRLHGPYNLFHKSSFFWMLHSSISEGNEIISQLWSSYYM